MIMILFRGDFVQKKIYNGVVVILFAALIVVLDAGYFTFLDRNASASGRVIIIDAGHGGIDGGAVGKNGVVEKNINLAIANMLKGYIETGGDTCIMIREVDEGLYSQQGTIRSKKYEDLKNRKQIIKDNDADILISIHLNSFPQSQYYGAQVFYNKGDEEGGKLAKLVQEELLKILDRGNKRVEKSSDMYYILKENSIPSILVECGFLSNPEEERLLQDMEYQNKISWSIYSGMEKYFHENK